LAQFKSRSLEQDTDDSIIASPAAKSKVSAFSFIISPPSRALNPPQLQYKEYWRIKITVTNFNYRMNYSQWNLIVQNPNFDNVTQVFSFNYKLLTPYEGLSKRGMMHPRGASCGKASTFGNFSWPTLLGCDSVFSKLAMIESNLDGKTLLKLAYGSKLFAK
ncbi:hypothetical protein S245_014076, partial [Arachis hypogaea]